MRILWVGSQPSVIGGQGRVAYFSIKELLFRGHQVFCCGTGGSIYENPEQALNCPCLPFNSSDPSTLEAAISQFKPEVVICSHDVWQFYCIVDLKPKFPDLKWVGWFTIDGTPIHRSWIQIFRAFDQIVVSTDYGKEVIYQKYPEKSIGVIEYGVDSDFSFEAQDWKRKIELKKQFGQLNHLPNFENRCCFIFAGANQFKKAPGTILNAFNILSSVFPTQVSLVLAFKDLECQIGPYRYPGEYDFSDAPRSDNTILLPQLLPQKALAELYQMADFLVYPSQGEAPGMQIAEAQLCGSIPICTDYTGMADESCFPEFLIREFSLFAGQFNVFRAMVDFRNLASYLERALTFWKELQADNPIAVGRYSEFLAKVSQKFQNRTWLNSTTELEEVLLSVTSEGEMIDRFLVKV